MICFDDKSFFAFTFNRYREKQNILRIVEKGFALCEESYLKEKCYHLFAEIRNKEKLRTGVESNFDYVFIGEPILKINKIQIQYIKQVKTL